MKAALPLNESERLKALQDYEILDTGPEQEFDDITRLASHICGTPIAMISLVDENRQWFKSTVGTTARETSRDTAFCAHGILQAEVLIVEDTLLDKRFALNPQVTGNSKIRFYAGTPLITAGGHALGMLCVNDQVPRALSDEQKAALQTLGRQVVTQLELRRNIAELKRKDAELRKSEERLKYLVKYNPAVILALKFIEGGMEPTWISDNHRAFMGHDAGTPISREWWIDHLHPEDRERVLAENASAHLDDRIIMEYRFRRKDGSYFWIRDEKVLIRDEAGNAIEAIGSLVNITDRMQMEEVLRWKTAFMEANINSSLDGVLVVDSQGRKILQNQRMNDLWKIPRHIIENDDDGKQIEWVTGKVINPVQFTEKVVYLYSHRDEIGRDEVELEDGTVLDRYSAPVVGSDGTYYGRIWTFRDVTARKRAEEALRESEERFRGTFEQAAVGIAHVSTEGRFLRVNDKLCATVGYDREELLCMSFADLSLPEEIAASQEARSAMLAGTQSSYTVEKRYRRKSGEVIWINLVTTLERTTGGDPKYFISVLEDIQQRKCVEEAIREKDVLSRIAGRVTHTGGWMVEMPSQRVFWSEELSDILECPRGKMPSLAEGLALYPDLWRDKVTTAMEACARDGTPFDMEVEVLTAKGRRFWTRICGEAERRADGSIQRVMGALQNISDRKRAEETLRLLSSAVEQSKESIVITDAQLDLPGPQILFVNPAFTLMTGYTAEEVIGRTPRILQGPRTDRAVLRRLRENLTRGEVFTGETVNYRKDGTEFQLEWQIGPIRNGAGKVTHFVAMQRDVTERKKLEDRLFQSQKLETIGKLAGGIAHEFNSIMTAIIGQSELLLVDLPEADSLRKNVTEIRKAANRAATLTRQLLAYGRKQILLPEVLDLNSVLGSMETMLRHLIGHDVDLRIIPAAGLKSVKVDAGQIEQVIMNLVMNAADAMPNGGKLTLETANVMLDQDYLSRVSESKTDEYVMLAITDTGRGMSEEVKARLFEPFFTTKDVGQGIGLGLATCHGIIKQSGGHIIAYSELGRGAAFKIYLPQVQKEAKSPAQRLHAPNMPRGIETILLVEDDPSLREMAGSLLERLGYTVLKAANGIEALGLTNQRGRGRIDLLFTDVVMPQMSGRELSDRIRSLYPQTKILFTSAYTENSIVHQGVLDDGVDLLQKPFTPSALAVKVREMLDGVIPKRGNEAVPGDKSTKQTNGENTP